MLLKYLSLSAYLSLSLSVSLSLCILECYLRAQPTAAVAACCCADAAVVVVVRRWCCCPVPLGPFPDHLTEDKCLKLHAIYRDAVQVRFQSVAFTHTSTNSSTAGRPRRSCVYIMPMGRLGLQATWQEIYQVQSKVLL